MAGEWEELLEFGSSADKAERTEDLEGQSWVLRLFLGGVHLYFALVWLAMCAVCAAIVVGVGYFAHQPLAALIVLCAFSSIFGLAGLLSGPHSVAELAKRTFLRAGALSLLGWLAVLLLGH